MAIAQKSEFISKKNYQTNKSTSIKWIFSHIKRNWYLFILTITLTIVNSIFSSSIPNLIGEAFLYFNQGILTISTLSSLSIQVLLFGIGAGLIQLIQSWSNEFISQRLERDSRDELLSSLLGKSLTFHDKQRIGDLMTRATGDVRQLNFMLSPGFNLVFRSIVGIIVPVTFMYLINPQLIIIPIIYVIVFITVLKKYRDKQAPVTMKTRIAASKTQSRLNETISGMYVVRAASEEEEERKIFQKNINEFKDAQVNLGEIQAKYWPTLILGIFTIAGILHSIILLDLLIINIGELISFILLFQLLRFPTFINIFAITVLTLGITAAGRILELLKGESNIDLNPDGYKETIKGDIEFKNISFGYGSSSLILKNINFKVSPGETIALVGITGSGKSTITKLLSRLYDPIDGKISIDGIDLKNWSIEALRSQMAIVEQDIFLFSKTIKENILLGNPDATISDIENAAKLANAHDFIMNTTDGYDSKIGERGTKLSGGQKQRIAIARAMIKKPKILILDDASSAIDSKTEDEINKAIKDVLKHQVSFLITHRIAQIRHADKIILLDDGEILDIGDHNYLIKNSTRYREIFSAYDGFDSLNIKEVA
ncbi:MAG: ABC transporter ATP-binding protein [Asgard group archaeon]|jgi:ATP-binding cassette subfamily B protein|nr:ABC transporter [Candidatus Heimdallarchaeota archaeon]MEC8704513.1 ABC transporter ATP-binding protein [Asgard group archaeon]|tara:strand:+ start:909 stop:2708 length:1800 start_codon:yes stop_codon:yes gene_type:complete